MKTLPRTKPYRLKANGAPQKVRTRGANFDKTIAPSAARGPRPNNVVESRSKMNINELKDIVNRAELHNWSFKVTVETPDDKTRYAVNGARVDHLNQELVIEIA